MPKQPEKEFNLLHEPWIRVVKPNGEREEVSILDLFRHAPKWKGLAGELPTQDVAVLRLLLAILHAIFGRLDLEGNEAFLCEDAESDATPATALERWKALWDRREFPMEVIEEYLQLPFIQERFWLFHPEFPFYQVAGIREATEYTAAKLNGELSESGNKMRLFPCRTGAEKGQLTYPEAARWLLYVNGFDDTSAKPKGKELPSPGAGWLGKLGLITAVGDNLFETLLLNMVLLPSGTDKLWEEEKPLWENEKVKGDERTEIVIPNNPSQLLTLQSRRLLLKREGDKVIGYSLLGGDFFAKENAFAEQMTLWRNNAKKEKELPQYVPRRHDPERQLWRDFSVLVAQGDENRIPGIVGWLIRLKDRGYIPYSHFNFQTAAVQYGDKDFFVDDVFSDSITINSGLLSSLGAGWINIVLEEISLADMLVGQAGRLAQRLAQAAGSGDSAGQRAMAQEQAYFRLDEPFRKWLKNINPEHDEMEAKCKDWFEEEKRIIRRLGRELMEQSGPQAFVGRAAKDDKTESYYAAPEAYNRFLYNTSSPDVLRRGKKK